MCKYYPGAGKMPCRTELQPSKNFYNPNCITVPIVEDLLKHNKYQRWLLAFFLCSFLYVFCAIFKMLKYLFFNKGGRTIKILIMNGNPYEKGNFDDFTSELKSKLEKDGHIANELILRNMDIKQCLGCWGCWVKTPGECLVKDDTVNIRREFITSDLVLMVSPIIMGFTSALLKKATDKLIPLIHPYNAIRNNEIHHLKRYDKYPYLGLLIKKSKDTDEEDLDIVSDIYRRMAINMATDLVLIKTFDTDIDEVTYEINNI